MSSLDTAAVGRQCINMAYTFRTTMTKKRKKQTSKAERHQAAGDSLLSQDRAAARTAGDAEARSRRALIS